VRPAVLLPWLQNLLPEGASLLTVGQALGISPQDVVGMAEACGLSGTAGLHIVAALAEKVAAEVTPAVEEVESMPAGSHLMLKLFAEEIVKRCALVVRNLRDDSSGDDRPDESQDDTGAVPGVTLDEVVSPPAGN